MDGRPGQAAGGHQGARTQGPKRSPAAAKSRHAAEHAKYRCHLQTSRSCNSTKLPQQPLACGWSVELAPRAAATSDSGATGARMLRLSRLKNAERCTASLDGRPGSGEGERLGRPPAAAPAAAAAADVPAAAKSAAAACALGRCCGTAEASMLPAACAIAGCRPTQSASQSSCVTTTRRREAGARGPVWSGRQVGQLSCVLACTGGQTWRGMRAAEGESQHTQLMNPASACSPMARQRQLTASTCDSWCQSSKPKMRASTSACDSDKRWRDHQRVVCVQPLGMSMAGSGGSSGSGAEPKGRGARQRGCPVGRRLLQSDATDLISMSSRCARAEAKRESPAK